MSIDEKILKVVDAVYCIDYITVHTVTPQWYRMNVDMYYTGDDDVEIVEISYTPECYAMPNYLTVDEFMSKSVSELKDLLEI